MVPFRRSASRSDAALQQLADEDLAWEVAGRSATGSTVDLERLGAGTYVVTLTATDPLTGLSEQTSRTIHVLADGDRDGLSDVVENDTPCFADDAASDGTSIDADSDGDGIPDGQDPAPCEAAAALTPTAIFDPETLYVPSKGASVTMYVKQDQGVPDLAGVVAGSVRLTSITGVLKSGATSTVSVVDKPFGQNKAWSVSGVVDHDQLGTAKFDRQGLNAFIADTFRLNQQLTLTLAGYSSLPSFTFTGSGTTLAKKG